MNKIYKVIWSKVKHQYVVVSELAHSNGKQSRTAKRSLRSRIAALVVCGAIAAFGVFGTQNVMAAEPEGGLATIDQYVAYKYNQGDGFQSGYKRVFVRDKNSTNPLDGQYYWVRNGYTVEGEYVQKQDGTGTTFVISKVYAPNGNIRDVLVTSDVTIDGTGVVTNSGEELNSVELGNYAAVSNGGKGGAEANTECHYIIETENGWENVGVGTDKFDKYFKTVDNDSENGLKYDNEKGVYTYKGEVVSSDNIYYIKDGDTVNAGVFVVNGEVYKSTVYGNTKEILTTVKDENGSLKTFWSTEAESSDIYLKDSNIKVSDLNTAFDTIEANEKRLENNDIREITVTPNENKIGLVRNSDKEVDGSIYVSSVVGENGNAQVKFAQKGEDGQETSSFVVDAGSIVKANPEGATSGTKLSTVAINGINYQLATGISGGEVGDDGTVYITQEGSTEKTPIGKIEVVGTDVNVTSEQTTNDGVKGIKYTVSNNLTVAEDKDTDENKGNWTITDASKPEGQQKFTNTTLDKAGSTVADGTTANGKVYGKTYTVKDTSGNTIQLTDVASGSVLQNVDSRVTTIEGNVITQGVRDTTGDTPKGNLLLQNAKGETVATVTGLEDYALKDQTVTVDDDGNAVFKVTDRYDPSKSYDVKLDGLVTEAGMATANNLKVEADNDGDGNNGNWTITDASKPEGQQKFTNTTLDKAGSTVADGTTANGKVYGKTYTVKDTSGNTIQLTDVASGSVLQNVDSRVTTIEGNVITQGVRDTTGDTPKGNLLLQNAKGETVATVTGLEDYALKDQTVTVDDDGNAVFKVTDRYDPSKSYDVKLDGLVTEAGMATANNLKVEADNDGDGNNGNWTITDASKPEGQQKFTNTTLDKAGSTVADGTTANGKVYGKTYTVKDTSGNTIQLIDVASGNVLQNVDSKVGDTNYSSTNYIHNEDNLTTAASILDSNIKATADKVDAGWTATAGGNSIAVNPTETGTTTLNFAGDKNINVTADKASSTINVKLDPTLEVESVTATGSVNVGRTTISSTGLTAGDVKVNAESATVTGLSNTTWNKDYKITTGQAATEDQLQAAVQDINTNSYKGWNVTTNKGTKTAEVASDGNVDFSNTDGNIIVGQDGTNLTFDLNDNIILGDESGTRIQLNGNPQENSMISITNKDSDTVFNIAKDGTVHSDGDIVAKADSNKKYSLSEVGENAVRYNENKSTVALAGTNGTTITNVADGDVSEGSKEAVNGSQLYATNQKVDAGWVATDGTNKIEVNPTDSGTTTLNFAGDNNITVTADTTNKAIQVALNDKVYLGGDHTEDSRNIVLDGERGVIGLGSNIALDGRDGTAVIGGVNIDTAYDEATGKPSSTMTGLSNTTWTDEIATAAADKKSEAAGTAATQGQLGDVASDLSDQITNSGWTASTNNGAVTTDITNGDKVDFANTDGNIAVNQTAVKDDKGNITGTNLTFDLNPDITLDDDVEDGNSVQLSGTNGTINAHNSELIFGGTGKYDNVNDMTFNQNGLTITNTQTMRDTGETTTSSTVINGGSIATGNITAGGITVNADNGGTVNGLTNKTWDADNYVSGQAATEDQLKSVSDKVNAGWIATDNNGNQITVNPKDNTLNFSGDRNVTVTANKEDGSIDVALNNEVQLGDFDNGTGVYLSGASGTISATNSISVGMDQGLVIDGNKKTINGLSNTTWDPENYVSGQAATEDQLQEAAAASKTTLSNGTNTNVTSTEKADGHIDYQVNLNKNINLNDRVYINGDLAEGNNTIVDIKSSDTSKEESIFAVEDKGNGSISIGGIDITNVDGPYLAVGDGKLKFYKDGGLATGNETGTLSVRPDGDLEISGKNSSFNVDAETGNVNAVNSSGSAIMMNDDSVALNASGNGVAISDEGILLNTNGIDEDIKLVTKGTSVSVDNDGATFTNTNTNETTNIDGGTINVGDRLMVEEDGSIYATNNNGSTVMINDNGVALNSEGNGVVVSGEGITLNTNGSAVTVDRFNGATFTNTNTGETTNINGDIITTDTVKGLSNTTWDDELATQVANSEELQGTAATQGQLQQAVSAVATEAAKQHTTVSGDDNLTVKSSVNENGGTNYQVTLDDDITLGNPKAGNTEGERSFTINTTAPEGYVPDSYKEENSSGAEFIKENGGFMLFATDTQGHGIFGVTAKGSAWAKDFKTYTTDIYGNNTQYSLNDVGDAVAQMSSYYNKENGKSYTVFSRYLNEAEKDNPFATVDENATRDIPLALRDDGAVLIGATIKGDDFTDNGIRINAETETTYDGDGNEVTNNIATITGLENTEWKPPTPVATFAANDINTTSRAATEAQLDDLYSAVAAYDVNVDGTIDYSHIALAGAPYGASRAGNGTPTGGTSITNVAYASGKDGSEAVNVDYLNDAISDAAENGSISTSDQHLVANTETGSNGVYKPNDDGNVNLIVSDEKGNSSTITIGDVASKEDLDNLKDDVGDLDYSKVEGDTIIDGDSVTDAIGKLDNKIENISGTATDADNNTVTGGKINSDGTISLTQKDKDSIKLEGQLTDSGVVQEGTSFDKETGTITITSQDKYSGETSSVKVEGIASTEVVGATNKEDLATAYKDADKDGNATTEYITDSESMVEADVALDHAIQDVANTSYANDMVLSNRIDSVEKRLGNVEERIDKVGAMAAAIANLRTMGFDPEAPTEIAIGVGQYKSETGIAIGVFHYPNQDFMLSASLSSSGDELMGGIGATWKLGRKSAAERAKDEEVRHLEQAEEMKKLAQQEKVKAQAQRHAKLLAERQQASQKNA